MWWHMRRKQISSSARNGRVHLNRPVGGVSSVDCWQPRCAASAVVMLDTPRSEVVWRVLATHSIRQFPLHFPSRASPNAIKFQLESTVGLSEPKSTIVEVKQSFFYARHEDVRIGGLGEWEYNAMHSLLKWERRQWTASYPGCCASTERAFGIHYKGGSVGLRAGFGVLETTKISSVFVRYVAQTQYELSFGNDKNIFGSFPVRSPDTIWTKFWKRQKYLRFFSGT
jgi:hypothetical protein